MDIYGKNIQIWSSMPNCLSPQALSLKYINIQTVIEKSQDYKNGTERLGLKGCD